MQIDLGLKAPILEALNDLGYEKPSPIQAECIPHLLNGRDVLGMAQTGSGKTAAFSLPLLQNLDPELKAPQILVLAPTRELAVQVAEAMTDFSKHMRGVNVVALYGGQRYDVQLRALRQGPQIVVGTPGRLLDHLKRGTLDLSKLSGLVLDEADEMLRMGFIEDVETIMAQIDPDQAVVDFYSLGLGEIYPIAASHGRGVLSLLEHVLLPWMEDLAPQEEVDEDAEYWAQFEAEENGEEEEEDDFDPQSLPIKLAIVGRPNVGKSTLTNRILGEERVVVYDMPGTTRDSIYIPMERDGREYVLIDTAGVRKRGKITDAVEKFSVIKTLQAIEDANVVMLVIDAREGISDQDRSARHLRPVRHPAQSSFSSFILLRTPPDAGYR